MGKYLSHAVFHASASMSMSSSSSLSLLTANEHHTFMSFLNNVDGADELAFASEWQTYSHLAPPHAEGSDALAKATKDLIALHPPPKYASPTHRHIAPAPPTPNLLPPPSRPGHGSHKLSLASPPPLSSQKRPSPTDSHTPTKRRRAASPSPSPTPGPSSSTPKPTLLSAQQKKANHIQSEQKRRANIRRGYEALCETVPALREAIRADEEGANGSGSGSGGGSTVGPPAGKRRRSKADERDGEKVDGRAGPRSESVVLQKTIEHIQGMLDEKNALLVRLDRARSVLGPGHPGLYSHHVPLWEREWDGGKGIIVDMDGEHDTDDDE